MDKVTLYSQMIEWQFNEYTVIAVKHIGTTVERRLAYDQCIYTSTVQDANREVYKLLQQGAIKLGEDESLQYEVYTWQQAEKDIDNNLL